jgi:gliding motility-associated-like protein
MLKKLLFTILLFGFAQIYSQSCPLLISPQDGDINVAVDATITWQDVTGVTGYIISIGTTDGGTDIINQRNVGSATSFTPPVGLPENSRIFVTISLFFLNQPNITCSSESFETEDVTTTPDCTIISNIVDGEVGVSVFTNILWNYASRATDYDIIIGTAPGLGDITDTNVTTLSFNPPGELPASTLIYVQVIPANGNGIASNCMEISFTTGALATLPGCTSLISPANGDINVPLTPLIEWQEVPGATGYRVTIGTSPTETNILDNTAFFTNSTFVLDFEPNRTFFITIIPFNSTGEAIGCIQESFSTQLGCGPYFDPFTGELVTLNPDLIFDSVFAFCENEGALELTAPAGAEGYRWYALNNLGAETLLVEDNTISITQNGDYRLEAYTTVSQSGSTIECPTLFDFEVVSSEIATINNLRILDTALGLQIIVEVSGNGDYEYAIDDSTGPYQDNNTFNAVTPGTHTLYVRDKNGCGIAEDTFMQDLTIEGFPKFFSPNGDLINDFWQFAQPATGDRIVLNSIRIYDRYGTFLKQITQDSQGWDGNFNGKPLPTGGYWFKAIDDTQREIKGFFTLKR